MTTEEEMAIVREEMDASRAVLAEMPSGPGSRWLEHLRRFTESQDLVVAEVERLRHAQQEARFETC